MSAAAVAIGVEMAGRQGSEVARLIEMARNARDPAVKRELLDRLREMGALPVEMS